MKINFSAPLLGLNNEPVKSAENGEDVTLGTICIHVLLTPQVDPVRGQPENLPANDKVRFAKLAQDIHGAKEPIDVTIEDVAMLKSRIGVAFPPLTVMRAFDLLDPQEAA